MRVGGGTNSTAFGLARCVIRQAILGLSGYATTLTSATPYNFVAEFSFASTHKAAQINSSGQDNVCILALTACAIDSATSTTWPPTGFSITTGQILLPVQSVQTLYLIGTSDVAGLTANIDLWVWFDPI